MFTTIYVLAAPLCFKINARPENYGELSLKWAIFWDNWRKWPKWILACWLLDRAYCAVVANSLMFQEGPCSMASCLGLRMITPLKSDANFAAYFPALLAGKNPRTRSLNLLKSHCPIPQWVLIERLGWPDSLVDGQTLWCKMLCLKVPLTCLHAWLVHSAHSAALCR